MPSIKYLCLDDQQDNTVDVLLQTISGSDGPVFERRTPIEVGAQILAVADFAAKNAGKFGLLVDLRLDMETDENGGRVPYRGPTLAQELRTRVAEGSIASPFPIVLWSIANNFKRSYWGEDTSHDLFDAVYGKDNEVLNEPLRVASEMKSLVNGYQALQMNTCEVRPTELLNLDTSDAGGVYTGFLDEFSIALESRAFHQAARLVITQLIEPPGLLAQEALVAARLGVDISASASNWIELKEQIENTRYSGPFFEGWSRWWWFKVEDWWSSLSEKQQNLRRISAAERVKFLNAKFGLSLVEAQPTPGSEGSKFFTLCVATGRPLDPCDGLRVTQLNRKPWHDTAYVSMEAALARVNKDRWRIDPIDRGRLDFAQKNRSL